MSNDTEQRKPITPLLQKDFKEAAYVMPTFFASLPEGTRVEDLADPQFWANVSQQMNVPAIVVAMPKDGAFFAEYMVRAKGHNWAHVEQLRFKNFVSAETVIADAAKDFEVNWGGPQKFRVQRRSDNAIVAKDFQTKEMANEWLAANVKAMSA